MRTNPKIIASIAAIVAFCAIGVGAKVWEWPTVKIILHVVDESDRPVPGASVKFVFGEAKNAKSIVNVQGTTNAEGVFTGEGHTDGMFGASVDKQGYYPSGVSTPALNDILNGKSQTVTGHSILRPIGRPVALFAKTGWFDIPAIGQRCGYDLEKGDWVAPYGSGSVPDFIFTLERRYEGRQDFEVKVRLQFANSTDGIQETRLPDVGYNSAFKWQREAPESGYQATITSRFAHKPGGGYENSAAENQAYFFRIRSTEEDGRIVSALYGKISGGLQLAPSDSKTCKVHITYFLNPTSLDRNLEWDTKRDLIPGLSFEQTPRDP